MLVFFCRLSEDWLVGVDLPYAWIKEEGERNDGVGNMALSTKYRFWRKDMLAAQESVALLANVILDTAHDAPHPGLSPGAADVETGIAYGYESLRWQRWASALYRYNGESEEGVDRGDAVFLNAVIGFRPEPPRYYEPDLMWLLEVNGEITWRSEQNSLGLRDSGGTELFVAPGFFLTYRNAALKGGIQLPVFSDLNGQQEASDYRIKVAMELHF
jgi:hypothetical protein